MATAEVRRADARRVASGRSHVCIREADDYQLPQQGRGARAVPGPCRPVRGDWLRRPLSTVCLQPIVSIITPYGVITSARLRT